MLGKTPNNVISESKKVFVLLSNKLFTVGDIFGSLIRRPNSRSFLVAISDSTEFRHDNVRSRGPCANLVLSTIKDGLVRYCNTKTVHNGVNNMWILKHSSLLSSLHFVDRLFYFCEWDGFLCWWI